MPNRTYIDLSREIDSNAGLYSSFSRRYESIKDSLTSEEIDPKIKEAVYAAMWNAKAWYALNGHLYNTMVSSGSVFSPPEYTNELPPIITENSSDIVTNIISKLTQIFSQTFLINRSLISASSQPTTFWGYEWGVNDWREELYEHLRMIDSIYGDAVVDSRSTQLALEQLADINEKMNDLIERIQTFNLPTNLSFIKQTTEIDYDKIETKLVEISLSGNQTSTTLNIESFNNLSKIEIPEQKAGQYLLTISNKNKVRILSSSRIDDYTMSLTLQNDCEMIGWYIDGKYPIIDFIKTNNANKTYQVKVGNIPNIDYSNMFLEEYYINPISIVVDVSLKVDNLIYNFFYGSFFDEYIETLENGNKIYSRTLKDTNGNITAIYQIELDYENSLVNSMPILKYQRQDV